MVLLEQVSGCRWCEAWVAAGKLHSDMHILASMCACFLAIECAHHMPSMLMYQPAVLQNDLNHGRVDLFFLLLAGERHLAFCCVLHPSRHFLFADSPFAAMHLPASWSKRHELAAVPCCLLLVDPTALTSLNWRGSLLPPLGCRCSGSHGRGHAVPFAHTTSAVACPTPAGLMLVNLVLFLWVAARYEYKALDKPRVHPPKAPRGVAPRWVRPRIVTGVSMVRLFQPRLAPCPSQHAECVHNGTDRVWQRTTMQMA